MFLLICGVRLGEGCTDRLIKDILETLLCQGGAFNVLAGMDFFSLSLAFLFCDGSTLALLLELVCGIIVISKIDLRPNDQNGHILVVLTHFRSPLRTDAVDCEGTTR